MVKDVNENPCNMCMPMGGIIALKGIEQSMVILHGSQGCSTYMRRHISEHFNEPIDVGSSSLNEKGTIYGGEKNLRQALDNIIRIYEPKAIGVLTTCLAETIGEDIHRICIEYSKEKKLSEPILITSPTPGYGSSHSEGYWSTARSIVSQLAKKTDQHSKVNVFIPILSSADIREMKRLFEVMEIEYTFCPDYSDSLDRPFSKQYNKVSKDGTPIAEIEKLAGAQATIQFGLTVDPALSPGHYLEQEFGVPLFNLPLPIGLENTDALMNVLAEISGKPIPEQLVKERGRLLDGMIDSHKYNFQGRSVIFGDPELVYAMTCTCFENGVYPVVVATGSSNQKLKKLLQPYLDKSPIQPEILDETDFVKIRERSVQREANIAIGHSDGRYLEEKEGIPLVRMGFPVLDRVGGQRILSVGYTGTMMFLDRLTNLLLENKHKTYRKSLYENYFEEGGDCHALS